MDLAARLRWIQCYGPRVATLRHLLTILAYHDNDRGGGCWAAVPTLAAETALSQRTIQYALADLCACGWVEPETAADRHGRYHANAGGRGHTTRYRIVYRDVPTETPHRRRRLTDRRFAAAAGETPHRVHQNPAPGARNPAPGAPEPRTGCGGSCIDPSGSCIDPRGGTPPSPPQEAVAAAPPQGADAPVVRPLSRAVLKAEAIRHGCAAGDDGGERWADVLERIAPTRISEVRMVIFQLNRAKRADHPDAGMLPPYHVDHILNYVDQVAAWLPTARAELDAASHHHRKESA